MRSITKSYWGRLLLLMLAFVVVIFFASMLFACGLGFQKRTIFLRGTYMVMAVIIVVFTVRWLCLKYDFAGLWRGLMNEFYNHQEDFMLKIHREYQELVNKYPLSVAEYESHCWKQQPRPSTPEIMESALAVSEIEWIEREKTARKKLEEKNHRK